jgi:hypothetical protein
VPELTTVSLFEITLNNPEPQKEVEPRRAPAVFRRRVYVKVYVLPIHHEHVEFLRFLAERVGFEPTIR